AVGQERQEAAAGQAQDHAAAMRKLESEREALKAALARQAEDHRQAVAAIEARLRNQMDDAVAEIQAARALAMAAQGQQHAAALKQATDEKAALAAAHQQAL